MILSRSTTLPVTVDQVKTHCRIDHAFDAAEQALVETYIKAATRYAENYTQTSIVDTTYEITLSCFPSRIQIGQRPLREIVSIKYRNGAGETATLPAENYHVCTDTLLASVMPADGTSFPASDSVTIQYTTGYEEIPEELQLAILYCAAHWYENREPIATGTIVTKVPLTIDSLLNLHCWGSYS